ncbi:MAG TPA: O-methyltransferase [Terriglobia bacterium]|nr:O-methyltransferase [Terriglobia bacterium]
MRNILEPKIEKYINSLLPPRDSVTREMERYAGQHDVPIIGPACGRLLHQLARTIRAQRVFELGSAIGYSTLWLARAVGPHGMVYYTDSDPSNAKRAQAYLRRAGVLPRVTILVGDALDMFGTTQGTFDLIFNDVNKTGYPEVFRRAISRLRVGGLFITDNVLWSGRVARPPAHGDADTRAIKTFNKLIYRSPNLFTTIVPLRDGMAVCEKIS